MCHHNIEGISTATYHVLNKLLKHNDTDVFTQQKTHLSIVENLRSTYDSTYGVATYVQSNMHHLIQFLPITTNTT